MDPIAVEPGWRPAAPSLGPNVFARPAGPAVAGVLETVLYGRDLDALERFYVEVLGLAPVARAAGRNVVLGCGQSALILFNPDVSRQPGRFFPPHGAEGPGHIAFAVPAEELPGWRERLDRAGVAVEKEVPWGETGRSLYFRDPAGNSVELAPPMLWGGPGTRRAGPR